MAWDSIRPPPDPSRSGLVSIVGTMPNSTRPSAPHPGNRFAKFLPRTISAASWMSPTKWAEQAIESEMMRRPEAPLSAGMTLGELDLPPESKHHRVITDDGGEIHVVELGQGPPIVLLHGVLLSVATWPYQIRELSRQHRVIAIDQRGHGRSSPGLEGYSINRLGRDLLDVLEALDVRDAVLVGHSMGGMVAMCVAIHRPKDLARHVSGMTLVATSADPLFNLPGLPVVVRLLSPGIRLFIEVAGGRAALANLRPLRYIGARVILGGKPSPANMEFAKALIRAASTRILAELWGQLLVFDVTDDLDKITLPCQVIVGDADLLTPPWHAIRMADKLRHASLIRFADCGHMVMFERHREMNRVILNFARQVQADSGGTVARRRITRAPGAKKRGSGNRS